MPRYPTATKDSYYSLFSFLLDFNFTAEVSLKSTQISLELGWRDLWLDEEFGPLRLSPWQSVGLSQDFSSK